MGCPAKAVHTGVQLDTEWPAGQRFDMAQQLVDGVDHRGQVQIVDHIGVAGHVAREHVDFRSRAKRFAQTCAFLGGGDEKPADTRVGEAARNPFQAQPVAVGLDHRSGFAIGFCIKRLPVSDKRGEVDCEGRCSHGAS